MRYPARYLKLLIVALCWLTLSFCTGIRQVYSASAADAEKTVAAQTVDEHQIPIPDRRSDKDAPKEGWCGETSVQMAALYFGAYIPQSVINKAGKPAHPDLWEYDIPTALDAFSLSYEPWKPVAPGHAPVQSQIAASGRVNPAPSKDIPLLLAWIRRQVFQDHPVVIGTKIYPTHHLDWDVDHIMLAVGFTKQGITINTNSRAGQLEVSNENLMSHHGYSFVNQTNVYYAFAVTGFKNPPHAVPVSLVVTKEMVGALSIEVQIRSLTPGKKYELRRDDLRGNVTTEGFVASSSTKRIPATVRVKEAAKFTCTAVEK